MRPNSHKERLEIAARSFLEEQHHGKNGVTHSDTRSTIDEK